MHKSVLDHTDTCNFLIGARIKARDPTYITKGPSAGVTLTSPNWWEIIIPLWFPSPHHILIREKDWGDIQWSDHPLMPLQSGLTQEEGLRQEIHLNTLSKRLLFMYEMLMRFPFRLPVSF